MTKEEIRKTLRDKTFIQQRNGEQDLILIAKIRENRSFTNYYLLPNGLELEIDGDGDCMIGVKLVEKALKGFSEMHEENEEAIADGCEKVWKLDWDIIYLDGGSSNFRWEAFHKDVIEKLKEYQEWFDGAWKNL